MRAAIGAVEANRSRYNITDYRWFDLRDADSASASFEDQYGLMTDDYTPKLGFDVITASSSPPTAIPLLGRARSSSPSNPVGVPGAP